MPIHADAALISRMSRGDSAALGVILERYWPSVVRYATGILRNRDDAEDVAQETFARIWERRDAWQVEGSVLPLLLRIARNSSIDALRRRATRDRASLLAFRLALPATPDMVLEKDELRTIVTAALDSLPERRREVLILVRMHGLSRKEVADLMDLAPQTVANHLRLAMQDLRAILAPYCDTAAEVPERKCVDSTALA